MLLYDYFRSTAAYRVRIALNLKGIAYERTEVHLVRDGGEHLKPAYRAINPQGRVPSLALDDGSILVQSPAILEWIEERYPAPCLLPGDATERARIRAVVALVACDIHPINNLSTLNYLRAHFGATPEAITAWYCHWIEEGFACIERMIEGGRFCFSDRPTLADAVLVPQVFNARRFDVPLGAFPKVVAVETACLQLEAFAAASPE